MAEEELLFSTDFSRGFSEDSSKILSVEFGIEVGKREPHEELDISL